MTYYTLNDLNIKLVDFIGLLSPLGYSKKIASNGNRHLVEIYFNQYLDIDNSVKSKELNFINSTLLKLYFDNKMGYIINNKLCILEIPNGIYDNDIYLDKLEIKNKISISKYLRKNIP